MNIKNLSLLIISGLIVTATVGCSSGGRAIPRNAICAADYDPLLTTDENKYGNKLVLKPGEDFQPAPADYSYQGTEIYYYDVDRNIKLHLAQTVNAKGNTTNSIICVSGSGITKGMEPLTFSIPLVSDIKIVDGEPTQVKNLEFSIDLQFNRPAGQPPLQYSAHSLDDDFVAGNPQDHYVNLPDFTEVEQTFVLVNGTDQHQLISQLKTTSHNKASNKDSNVVVRTMVTMKPKATAPVFAY